MATLLTVGQVADRLDEPRPRVDYALAKARIRERARAGILRLFDETQLPEIRAALETIRVRQPQPVARA